MNNLRNNIESLLSSYEYAHGSTYTYSEAGINEILNEWKENKAEIIEAFSNHPSYNGNYQIVLNEKFRRELDRDTVHSELRWFNKQAYSKTNDVLCGQLSNFIDWLEFCANITENKVRQDMVIRSIQHFGDNPKLRLHEGQKLSKGLRKIFTECGLNEVEDFEKHYAKLADALSPIEIERPFVLSVNPLDYLTMSFGLNWTSCHTIDKTDKRGDDCNNYQGCYSSGTLSYMLDSSSIVMYTLPKGADLTNPEELDKVQRQMCHYSNEAKKIVFGRIYPTSEDDDNTYRHFREIAQRVISECFNVTNLWNTKKGPSEVGMHVISEGTHYRDYIEYSVGAISIHQYPVKNLNGITLDLGVQIGHNPICPNCGNMHTVDQTILCDDCAEYITCERCGEHLAGNYIEMPGGYCYCDASCARDDGYVETVDDGWHYEDDCCYDRYDSCWYYYTEDGITTENGTWFVNEDHARAEGFEQDSYTDEWVKETDDSVRIGNCFYNDPENAELDGWVIDEYSGNYFRPTSDSVFIDGCHYETRENAILDGREAA